MNLSSSFPSAGGGGCSHPHPLCELALKAGLSESSFAEYRKLHKTRHELLLFFSSFSLGESRHEILSKQLSTANYYFIDDLRFSYSLSQLYFF